ncbi:sigma-70 family RNA polymerase sigma factor [Alcaligenaceae bacterium]|nr:sigma-70 family RNA polymerase sigma factor [Alcaligenaceae bacterium]
MWARLHNRAFNSGNQATVTPPSGDFDYEAALAACAAGQRDALQRIYTHEGGRLLGVILRIVRDSAMAEDIVHDTCIKIWTGASRYDPAKGTARGWIYSIARHLALNVVRDGGRHIDLDEDTVSSLDDRASVEAWKDMNDSFAWQSSPGRITLCLEQLEPVRRNCILHAYVDGFSHREIAERLNAPLGTIKAWIKRSLAALRECMT